MEGSATLCSNLLTLHRIVICRSHPGAKASAADSVSRCASQRGVANSKEQCLVLASHGVSQSRVLRLIVAVVALAAWWAIDQAAAGPADAVAGPLVVAQAMVPPTGMGSEDKAMAAEKMPAADRMRRRFPQPATVASLIGLPLIDENARTLGYVRRIVRTRQGATKLIVTYDGFLGWGARLIAVPIEVVGIAGRQLVSLDMPASDYVGASTWHPNGEEEVPDDASISVALARR
jgi:hypothetical protein